MSKQSMKSRRDFIMTGLLVLPFIKHDALADTCNATETNIRGPFYRPNAPWKTSLAGSHEPGETLIISGRVFGADTCKPLKGAVVDVWQANAAGHYDNDDASHPPDPKKFILRGQMKTDKKGRYKFRTILPGNYQDEELWRARHIHYIISVPGYSSLITQCYFKGDPYNDTDILVKASLIIDLKTSGSKKKRHKGTFDIVLVKA